MEEINFPEDLRKLKPEQLPELCKQLREYIIDTVRTHGGHFAANLGVIELTVALHYVFNTPDDRLVWDVGHQAYAHKILTGRKNSFHTNRKFGGLSGFPKISESPFDAFGTGHSSTSISAILGMAMASKLDGNSGRQHIAVVGDGALTAGQAFEGLNNLSPSSGNVLILVNDNNIGIDENTGAINRHLNSINRQQNIFTDLGLDYAGPVDGHDVILLVDEFKKQKEIRTPRVLHIKTVKGKGYEPAEKEQTKWHSTSKYVKIKEPTEGQNKNSLKYQDVLGETLLELASNSEKIVGITPAMPTGSGMIKAMKAYPDRFFDVGIAEQHAVTFAGGLAGEGFVVFCCIYSTFLQRGYDQLIHDICLQNLPVIFCIDRAGNVGDDGPTHHGIFDIAMLNPLPNLQIVAPSNGSELRQCMHYYAKNLHGPVCIRYPKGYSNTDLSELKFLPKTDVAPGMSCLKQGSDLLILSLGNMRETALEVSEEFNKINISVAVYNQLLVKPLNSIILKDLFSKYSLVVTLEDGSITGGFGQRIRAYADEENINIRVFNFGYPETVLEQGTQEEIMDHYGLSANKIFHKLKMIINNRL